VTPARRRGEGAAGVVAGRPPRASDAREAILLANDERFRLATEALAGFLYDYDLTTGCVEHFGGMEDVLGYGLSEVPPGPEWWIERIHPDDLSRVMQVANETLAGPAGAYLYEYRIRRREGQYIHILDRGRIIRDDSGGAVRVLGGVVDVSDRKRAEEALHAERRRTEREREALLEREQQAHASAEAAIRIRDELLGVVYHDLRAPLSVIALCASALSENRAPTPEGVQEVVGAIHRSTEWMQRLIRDLVDLANIQGAGLTVELRDQPPAPILEAIAELFAQQARMHGVLLEIRIPAVLPLVRADGDRVLQALANLVNNAIRFTDPGGQVTLRAEPEAAAICFSVEDTGVGIRADDLPHIFDRYWHKSRGAENGRGLGLAIVRGIVNAHGGRVDVSSTPGKGSRFSFAIPAAPG
jgi:PAS domain S-box-containing protein